jgi:hypothetical protein
VVAKAVAKEAARAIVATVVARMAVATAVDAWPRGGGPDGPSHRQESCRAATRNAPRRAGVVD